ncbi:unnamed protein product [Cunninghamella blakesleeana]
MSDILSTYIKYSEGFYVLPDKNVVSKPFDKWTPEHQEPMIVMNYVQAVTFSLQVSILLLLQCFWNYISNTVAKRTFMSSKEFAVYIIWTILSLAMFPILQWRYRDDAALQEVAPQMAYACEILFVSGIGFYNNIRFNRLIKASMGGKRKDITDRLTYFRDMNLLLTVCLLVFGVSMFILCVDGFTATKTINMNKFASDLLICNVNVSCIFLWIILINIFHPSKPAIEPNGTTDPGSHQKLSSTPNKNSVPLKPLTSPTNAYTNNSNSGKNNAYYMNAISSDNYNEPNLNNKNNNNNNSSNMNIKKDADSGYGFSTSPPKSNYGYSTSPPKSPTSTISYNINNQYQPKQNPRDQIISITDPFMKEPVTFSMVNPTQSNTSNSNINSTLTTTHPNTTTTTKNPTISYASGLDYYGINNKQSMATTPSPVPSTPSPYQSNSYQQQQHYESTVSSYPSVPRPPLPSSPFPSSEYQYSQYDPNYDISAATTSSATQNSIRYEDDWLSKPTTSPSKNGSSPLHYN